MFLQIAGFEIKLNLLLVLKYLLSYDICSVVYISVKYFISYEYNMVWTRPQLPSQFEPATGLFDA